jgi:hypothetical protein
MCLVVTVSATRIGVVFVIGPAEAHTHIESRGDDGGDDDHRAGHFDYRMR